MKSDPQLSFLSLRKLSYMWLIFLLLSDIMISLSHQDPAVLNWTIFIGYTSLSRATINFNILLNKMFVHF